MFIYTTVYTHNMNTTPNRRPSLASLFGEGLHIATSEFVARRNTVYLVQKGMPPDVAVSRVMTYQRKFELYTRATPWAWILLALALLSAVLAPAFPVFDYFAPNSHTTATGGEVAKQVLVALAWYPLLLAGPIAGILLLLSYPARLRKEMCRGIPEWDARSTWQAMKTLRNNPLPDGWMESPASRPRDVKIVRTVRALPVILVSLVAGFILLVIAIGLIEPHWKCGSGVTYRPSEACRVQLKGGN